MLICKLFMTLLVTFFNVDLLRPFLNQIKKKDDFQILLLYKDRDNINMTICD